MEDDAPGLLNFGVLDFASGPPRRALDTALPAGKSLGIPGAALGSFAERFGVPCWSVELASLG